jgi:hypothetical protein
VNAAGRQDDFARGDSGPRTGALDKNAGDVLAVEQNAQHARIAHDDEVGPRPRLGGEIAARAGGAFVILAERGGKKAVLVGVVDIGVRRHSLPDQHLLEAPHVGGPARTRQPPHDVGSAHVALGAGGVMVVGHGLEGRQHIAPAPVARAHLLPSVVVGRQTTERYHAHHARAAAHDARLQEGDRRLALAIAGGQAGPEVFAVDIGGGKDIADVGWYLARCGVPSGFDQQDAAGGAFRQPRR